MNTSGSTIVAIISLSLFILSGGPVGAGCISTTCYCGVQLSCGASNEDCIRACGDEVPSSSPPTFYAPPPSYDWQSERSGPQQGVDEENRRIKAAEEAKRLEEEQRKQFEEDKKNALNLLKSGTEQLGLKGPGAGTTLKDGVGEEVMLKGSTPQVKGPLFSKGTKDSAPPSLGGLDPEWPIVRDLKKVQEGTPEALLTANRRTQILLTALQVHPDDWEGSIRYLENRLAESPDDIAVRDALNLLHGYYQGYLGAKNVADNYYRYGVRKWLAGDFDQAARSFARAVRENPADELVFRSFAHALGLRDGSGRCGSSGVCSHIEVPREQIAKEEGFIEKMKHDLEKARADVAANPENLELRATFNYLEGYAGYNDYLDVALDRKPTPRDRKTWDIIHQGLDKMGRDDFHGAWKDFSRAFAENKDDRQLLFVINYAKGLDAARRGKTENVPETLWDQRTNEAYDRYIEEFQDEILAEMMGQPPTMKTSRLAQQLKNTDQENPFFGVLSREQIQGLKKMAAFLFR
jgi:tetratricopeptide (TPR) repeat protein